MNRAGKVIFNQQVKRTKLISVIQNHPDALIAMGACGSYHYWCRELNKPGYKVRLIPAQHVKALSRGNKNDAHDDLAIAESVFRPNIHACCPQNTSEK